ncbi:MAG: hypothetical protein ABR564_09430 [Candidatus Dormibacteria bacterium]
MILTLRGSRAQGSGRPHARFSVWLPGSTLGRELLVAGSRPRALVIKVLFPLLMTVPLVAARAPRFWAAALLTVMVAMIGTVGSAVAVARARQSGLLTRLALTPRPAWRILGGWVLAGTLVDALQILPVLTLASAGGGRIEGLPLLALAATACLLTAAVVGCVVAACGGGLGEVLLDVTVVLAPLLYLGGLFTGVPRSGWRFGAALVDPFGQLDSAFLNALGAGGAFGVETIGLVSLVVIVTALAALGLLSRWILERGG